MAKQGAFEMTFSINRRVLVSKYQSEAPVKGRCRRFGSARGLHWPLRLLCFCLVWEAISASTMDGAQSANRDGRFTEAEFSAHVANVRKKLPSDDFTIVVTPPFVVIGDESPETVRRRADNTVKWAVDKLKKAYFSSDPKEILDIWLFKDKASYETHAKELFGKKPDTPYGYFSDADKALVMNIATGGGTLVHEIVHPFVAANFPGCPAWFNEGLGSLYEQSGEVGGEIHGYTNWRLDGLQRAIHKGNLPSFETLCGTTDTEFYEKDRGANYAQARYLCYYLQQKGLLRNYYRRFLANRQDDPSGYKTLVAVLRRKDMDKFQQEWEAYVLKLEFRNR
jgi:hypothetical protein